MKTGEIIAEERQQMDVRWTLGVLNSTEMTVVKQAKYDTHKIR